jgi:hypothetical protein
MGAEGTLDKTDGDSGTTVYQWGGDTWKITATFRDDKLIAKNQAGLP